MTAALLNAIKDQNPVETFGAVSDLIRGAKLTFAGVVNPEVKVDIPTVIFDYNSIWTQTADAPPPLGIPELAYVELSTVAIHMHSMPTSIPVQCYAPAIRLLLINKISSICDEFEMDLENRSYTFTIEGVPFRLPMTRQLINAFDMAQNGYSALCYNVLDNHDVLPSMNALASIIDVAFNTSLHWLDVINKAVRETSRDYLAFYQK